jgi:hypothetical protein
MKIRNGFVSNSSSSSFVVLLPKDFSVTAAMVSGLKDYRVTVEELGGAEQTAETIRSVLIDLRKRKQIYAEECNSVFNVLVELMRDYVVGAMDTGPDAGQIVLADEKKLRKLLA